MDALTTNVPRKKWNERKGKGQERKGSKKENRKKKRKVACPLAIILEYSFIFNIFQ